MMANMSVAVEQTRVSGWHRCAGCLGFIHTAVFCKVFCRAVCEGETEGVYRCGHCHLPRALVRLDDALPTGDDGGSLPDDDEEQEQEQVRTTPHL